MDSQALSSSLVEPESTAEKPNHLSGGYSSDDEDYGGVTTPLHSNGYRSKIVKNSSFGSDSIHKEIDYRPSYLISYSPQPSLSSLSSWKEKLLNSVPPPLSRTKKQEIKILAFVTLLFALILTGVSLTYIFYQQAKLQMIISEGIRFFKEQRGLHIHGSSEGNIVLKVDVGVSLPPLIKPYNCLAETTKPFDRFCVEWKNIARLHIAFNLTALIYKRCYNVFWESLLPSFSPLDCIRLEEDTTVFGGGETTYTDRLSPFMTGQHPWGNVLSPKWTTNKGVSIIVHKNHPLHVSYESRKSLCFQSQYDGRAYRPPFSNPNQPSNLSYTICVADNIVKAEEIILKPLLDVGNLTTGLKLAQLITKPIWNYGPFLNFIDFSQDDLVTLINSTFANYSYSPGHIIIDKQWQEHIGDLDFDYKTFPDFNSTVEFFEELGVNVVLEISPFISTSSQTYLEALREQALLTEEDNNIPALTSLPYLPSAAMVDFTSPNASEWFTDKVLAIINDYPGVTFYLDAGTSVDSPPGSYFKNMDISKDQHNLLFAEAINDVGEILGVSSISSEVVNPDKIPLVTLKPRYSTWEDLKSLLPSIIGVSLLGHSLFLPSPVGGWPLHKDRLPDKELYIRWLQLQTFLPVQQFLVFPEMYGDPEILHIAWKLKELRETLIVPVYEEVLSSGTWTPVLQPIWNLDMSLAQEGNATMNQFAVGKKIIFAPVLEEGVRKRGLYLPEGLWKEVSSDLIYKGGKWYSDVAAPLEFPLYFTHLPTHGS